MTDKTSDLVTNAAPVQDDAHKFHYARRGSTIEDKAIDRNAIKGYDDDRMRARTLLTAEEEKKLMRRVDWRLMVRKHSSQSCRQPILTWPDNLLDHVSFEEH